MIHTLGEYVGMQYSMDGEEVIMFAIDDIPPEQLECLKNSTLVIEAKKYRKGRSISANAYFWKLCDLIAKQLGSDKDTIYILELKNHGVFDFLEIREEAIPIIKKLYRHTEEAYRYSTDAGEGIITMVAMKCYTGSSQYDTKQMANLINGTVNDAKELGITTWSENEIENLIANWRGVNNGKSIDSSNTSREDSSKISEGQRG